MRDGTSPDYNALDEFLASDAAPAESMAISDLDGFLTGVAIGPELIMPIEWLPVIWGGEEPVFADAKEAGTIMGAIMSRYNEILRDVEDGTFEPILWDVSGVVIAADWAEGFAQAIDLRSKSWEPLFEDEDHAPLLFPILACCGDENGESALGLDREAEDRAFEAAPGLIPDCVIGIADFWRKRRSGQPGTLHVDIARSGTSVKVGRNDPCPCGSGKKFKKCCGQ